MATRMGRKDYLAILALSGGSNAFTFNRRKIMRKLVLIGATVVATAGLVGLPDFGQMGGRQELVHISG